MCDFLFQKIETGPIPWEFDFEILVIFWNCVGGTQMRRFFILKSANVLILFRRSISYNRYKIRGTHLVLSKPTQFQLT